MTASTFIPVHILTGFLGSGKTTLLNHALIAGLGAETAVVVNEFGDIGLDQLFIQARSEETIVLKSGCVCCTIRSDLVSTLMQLLAMRGREKPFERILIETAGVSDPVPILQTLRSDFNLLTRFRIASVLCTLDASQHDALPQTLEGVAQITAADGVVLTKTDLAAPGDVERARASLSRLNPLAEPVPADGAALVEWLQRVESRSDDSPRALNLAAAAPAETRHHHFQSTVLRATAPQSWSRFAIWLTRLVFLHGDRILRIKGVLFDRERAAWIGVHGVRRFFYPPMHLQLASPPECGACLVFITDGIAGSSLERSYRRFVEASEASTPAPLPSLERARKAAGALGHG